MKKISTLIIMLMTALSSWAQGFAFQYQGQTLAEGETVIIAAEEDLFGDLTCETNSALNPTDGLMLKRLSSMGTMATATLQITENTLNADMMQWCMGGECTPIVNQASLTKRFQVEDYVGVQFDAIGIKSEGLLMATLKVSIGIESHEVKIMFVNGDADGIDSITPDPLPFFRGNEEALSPFRGNEKVNGKWLNGKWYDLRGRQMHGQLQPGIYVVTDGTRSRKIVIPNP